jgi:Kef-type K+ transport system membrane component KefB
VVAIQVLRERGEIAQAHGRAGFGVLLFQDLAVIPMLAIVRLLALVPAVEGRLERLFAQDPGA